MREILFGRNAVREALRARRRHFHRLLLVDTVQPSAIVEEILSLAGQLKAPVQRISRQELDNLARGNQGVALEVGRYPLVHVNDILEWAAKLEEPAFILVLDHIEDPHNLGAMLRTAEIVGVHGVILPKQRAASITPTVVNVSSGAAEHSRVAEVPNLVQVLKTLQEADVWVAGVEDVPGAVGYHQANLAGPMALVLGNEGKGLSRLVRETCDFLIKLPMRGQIESLNASVACGVILYEVWRARGFKNFLN